MNWAGKMIVEFFYIEISAIVCRVSEDETENAGVAACALVG